MPQRPARPTPGSPTPARPAASGAASDGWMFEAGLLGIVIALVVIGLLGAVALHGEWPNRTVTRTRPPAVDSTATPPRPPTGD